MRVTEVAQKAGVDKSEAKQGLAALIPQLVDKLTPDGSVPSTDRVGQLLGGMDVGKLFH